MKSAVRTTSPVDQADRGVVWLDDPRARAPDLVGAKAAALAAARRAGLSVLPGVVVTTTFDNRLAEHRAALREAWSSISHAGELSLVVRSSSTIEDSASSSMAGMFTSVLDVCGWERFEAAIDSVLASSNVVALAEGPSAEGRPAPMAVLVQPYLASASGGVLFGLDPVSGRSDRFVVSATDRGPAALVSGEVDGIRYVLSRRGRLVERPTGRAGRGPLSRPQLRELAAVARHAERLFGGPQDIEWAFDGAGALLLLQSRPVTARGDAAVAEGPVFGPGPIAETFPEPLSPLEEDLWAVPLRDGLRHALALAGTVPRRKLATSPILVSVQGRLALDLDVIPGAAPRSSLVSRLDPRPPLRRLTAAWRVGRLRAALPVLAADLLEKADDDLLAVDAATELTDGELLGLLGNARQGLTALHGHEVLMGWLVHSTDAKGTVTAASVALRLLAEGRAEGLTDEEIVARDPGVLALTSPRVAPESYLPPTPDGVAPGSGATPSPAPDDPAILREALRLRGRWVQELTARAAWELGRRLAGRGVISRPEQVRLLSLEELEVAVRTGVAPGAIGERKLPRSAPLPARFQRTVRGAIVAVRIGGRSAAGAQGAGGGRGVGVVHDGSAAIPEGAVLVVRTLDPGLASVLPRLAGLVAETGSVLSHLAILAREFGVPTVVGVEEATVRFPPGSLVVVDGTAGEVQLLEAERGAA